MNDLIDNIFKQDTLKPMADAIEISTDTMILDDSGDPILPGNGDAPIKAIQVLDDKQYAFLVETESYQKWVAIEKKLTDIGMKLAWKPRRTNRGYFSSSRLPEAHETEDIRKLMGLRKMRAKQRGILLKSDSQVGGQQGVK